MRSKVVVKIIGLLVILMLPVIVFAQALPACTYGQMQSERCAGIVYRNAPPVPNGVAMAGWTTSFGIQGDTNVLVVQTDANGVPNYPAKISTGPLADAATSIIKSGSGYVIAGWTRSYPITGGSNDANIFVVKLDAALNYLWGKVYGGTADDKAYSIIHTSDNGYILTGSTASFGAAPYPNIITLKLNSIGIVQWAGVYNRAPNWGADEGFSIAEIPIGLSPARYAVAGRTFSLELSQYPNYDAFVMWIDAVGNLVNTPNNTAIIQGWSNDEAHSVIWDGFNTVVTGWTESYGPQIQGDTTANIFFTKFPPACGPTLLNKVYGWPQGDEKVEGDQALLDDNGHYTLCGWTNSKGPGAPPNSNFLIMHLDNNGNILWSRIHPSDPAATGSEQAFGITHTPFLNGGYAVAGWGNSFSFGGDDFHLVCIDSAGNRPVCVLDSTPLTDTCVWTPNIMAHAPEMVDTTWMPLIDTAVLYTNICIDTLSQSDATPTDIGVPDTVQVCDTIWIPVTIQNLGPHTLAAGWYFYLEIEQNNTVWKRCSAYVNVPILMGGTYTDSFYIHFGNRCNHLARAITAYPHDINNSNDTLTKSFVAQSRDLGISTISLYPSPNYNLNDLIFVTIPVVNHCGHVAESTFTGWLYLQITRPNLTVTRDSGQFFDLNPGSTVAIRFPSTGEYTLDQSGTWNIHAYILFDPDNIPEDNSKDTSFMVSTVVPGGWTQKEPITDVVNAIKDGGALVGVGDYLYGFVGTKTMKFRMYSISTKSGWTDADTMIFGRKYKPTTGVADSSKFNKKFVGKGAALCYDDASKIYAIKGNGTYEFYGYDVIADVGWTPLAWIPASKAMKAGASLAYLGGKVYLLAGGYKPTDPSNFYAYDVATNTWAPKAGVSFGPTYKPWKAGSCLAVLDGKIYALQGGGKGNYFFVYTPEGDTLGGTPWAALESMPNENTLFGKYKKKVLVKDGGAMAAGGGSIYAIKGGGTNLFWKYTPISDVGWTSLCSIPVIDKKHAPKTGAAIAYADNKVWVLCGQKTPDFWCYTPEAKSNIKYQISKVTQTVNNQSLIPNPQPHFQVNPNPFTKLTTIKYNIPISGKVSLKLYNTSGRLVKTIFDGYLNSGSYSSTLSHIAGGVYFLRYNDASSSTETKLIIE